MTLNKDSHNGSLMAKKYGTSPKTLKVYLIGLFLCLLLTFTSFILVMYHLMSPRGIYLSLSALALIQLLVQIICFLRLNTNPEGLWNSMSFIFVLLIVVVIVSGTFWIMYNLHYYMVAH